MVNVRVFVLVLFCLQYLYADSSEIKGSWCIVQRIGKTIIDSSYANRSFRAELNRLAERGPVDSGKVRELAASYKAYKDSINGVGLRKQIFDYNYGTLKTEEFGSSSVLVRSKVEKSQDTSGFHCLQIDDSMIRIIKEDANYFSGFRKFDERTSIYDVDCVQEKYWSMFVDEEEFLHIVGLNEMVYKKVAAFPIAPFYSNWFSNCGRFRREISSSVIAE